MSDLKQQTKTLAQQHTPEELADMYVKLKAQRELFDTGTTHQLSLVVQDLSLVNFVLKDGEHTKALSVLVEGIVEALQKEIELISGRHGEGRS